MNFNVAYEKELIQSSKYCTEYYSLYFPGGNDRKHYAGSDPDSLCYRKSKNNIYELSFLIVCFSYPRSVKFQVSKATERSPTFKMSSHLIRDIDLR